MEENIKNDVELEAEIDIKPDIETGASSINEFESKMTVFYNKRIGLINCIFSGIQDFSVYGEEAEDFKLILDAVVLDYDEFVISNPSKFIVQENQIVLSSIPDYLIKYRCIGIMQEG